jgi:hypothetical protein
MFGPIVNILNQILTSAQPIIAPLIGLALLMYGAILAAGNHAKAREGIICAIIGGAIMLGSQQIAAAIHP